MWTRKSLATVAHQLHHNLGSVPERWDGHQTNLRTSAAAICFEIFEWWMKQMFAAKCTAKGCEQLQTTFTRSC